MPQLTYYADDDVAEWVEDVAEESTRSKSQVVVLILEEIMDEMDGDSVPVERLEINAVENGPA